MVFSSSVIDLAQQAIAVAQSGKQVGQSKNGSVNAMVAVNAGWQAYQTGKSAQDIIAADPKKAATQVSISITYNIADKTGTILIVGKQIHLQSAEQASTKRSKNKSEGFNVGAAVSFGQGDWSLGFTASGNIGKGYGNGDDLTHCHSHIGDTNSHQAIIQSGGDTTLKGVQVNAQNSVLKASKDITKSWENFVFFNKSKNLFGNMIRCGLIEF